MSESTESWKSVTLDSLLPPGGIFDGPFGSNLKTSDYTESGVRVIRLENLANLRFIEQKRTYISEEKYESLKRHTVREGDILFGSFIDGLPRVCVLPKLDTVAIAKADCFCLRPGDDVDRKFLAYQLGTQMVRDALIEQIHGATRPRITTRQLRQLRVVLPPLPEQRRIVEEVEALLARVNAARDRLTKIPTILKRFRQSILAAAYSGDLTAEWRSNYSNVEPAALLLDRIREERYKTWQIDEGAKLAARGITPIDNRRKQRYPEPTRIDTAAHGELPEGWEWATLDQLSTKISDGVHKKPDYVEVGVPFLTVKNLTQSPSITFDECRFVTERDHCEFIKRTKPERGDLLVTKDGTLGVARVVETDRVFSIFVSLALVKPVEKALSKFLQLAISAPQGQNSMKATGTGLMHIHLVDLRAAIVPVCPLEEATEIVRRVEQHEVWIRSVEKRVQTARSYLAFIESSVLARAVRGKLADARTGV